MSKYSICKNNYPKIQIPSDSAEQNTIDNLLKYKWIALKKLILSMLSSVPNERPTCDEILNNEQWSITNRELTSFRLDDSNMLINQAEHFFYNYFKQKLLSINRFDKRFKVLKNVVNGCYGNVFNVEQECDKKMFMIKKITNSIFTLKLYDMSINFLKCSLLIIYR